MSDSAATLIIGAASAIGRATAQRLATRGDHVVMADIDERGLAEAAAASSVRGGNVEMCVLDQAVRASVERMCADLDRRLGGIKYLYSNAGVVRRGLVSDLTSEDWQIVVDTNLTRAFHLCQSVLPHMLERHGAVVLSSSDLAVVGRAGHATYAATSTALYALAKALALEFAPHRVRVNAIGPGAIEEDVGRVLTGPAGVPMGRLGRPEEVAGVVEFLLSDRAAYITGQLLQPNGGRVMF